MTLRTQPLATGPQVRQASPMNLRILTLLSVVAVAVASAACNPTVSFDVPVAADTTVPKGTALEQLLSNVGLSQLLAVDVSQTQAFKNQNVQRNQVVSAKLTQLDLDVTAPNGGNFDWLQKITFLVDASGQTQGTVASKTVAAGTTAFSCDLADLELAPYVRADSFAITTNATAHHPDADTTVHLALSIHIEANVFAK
jgi:hypothetical protein